MKYIQFYQRNLAGLLDEATGDRSVVIVDGRLSNANIGKIADIECKKRRYIAWAVFVGESFTQSRRISQVTYVQSQNVVHNPVWLSAHGM